ncbi:MAG: 3-deoxy-D-manno-octulosonic acid transferase [Proteobacteria bacterium]|nr:3-deoxy-D-manno-octulosonic acid transferase [Pseudomonadota bacterium]
MLRKLGFYSKNDQFENTIVIHCVSVGEILSAIPFINKISQMFKKNIILTTTTQTGWKIANEKLKNTVKKIEFFPFDFPFAVLSFINIYSPRCIIITETELWPNVIFFSKLKKIPLFVINGRISDRSFPRYKKLRWFFRKFLDYPFFLMQGELDKERIIEIGAIQEKVIVTGNIKYDFMLEDQKFKREDFGLSNNDLVVIAGSTHNGEEEIILQTFKELKNNFKNLKLIIAPRHPERFGIVENLMKEKGFKYTLRIENKFTEEVMLLNTIGELKIFYSLCDIAFVGGSLVNIGGHNIIEPAVFEKPVIFGPYMHNFRDISESFLKNGGALQVNEETISKKLLELLSNSELRKAMGKKAKEIVLKNSGSLEKTLNFILDKLDVRENNQ